MGKTNVSEVAPQIYQIALPHLRTPVYSYLIADEIPTLVDIGCPVAGGEEALLSGLAALGLRLEDIQQIVYTHSHIDHMGLGFQLQDRIRAVQLAHPDAVPFAEDCSTWSRTWQNLYHWFRDNLADFPGLEDAWAAWSNQFGQLQGRVCLACTLQNGETISTGRRDWEVIYTPGHARDHISLFQRTDRTLIAGDVALAFIPVIVEAVDGDISAYRRTLQELEALAPERVLPGHGQITPPIEVFQRSRASFQKHERLLLEGVAAGIHTVPGLLKRFPGGSVDEPGRRFIALCNLWSWIGYLESEGRLKVETDRKGYRVLPVGGPTL